MNFKKDSEDIPYFFQGRRYTQEATNKISEFSEYYQPVATHFYKYKESLKKYEGNFILIFVSKISINNLGLTSHLLGHLLGQLPDKCKETHIGRIAFPQKLNA